MKYKVLLYLIMIVSYFMLLHTGDVQMQKNQKILFMMKTNIVKLQKKQYYMIPFILQFATR